VDYGKLKQGLRGEFQRFSRTAVCDRQAASHARVENFVDRGGKYVEKYS
jgi:hypothetical protein